VVSYYLALGWTPINACMTGAKTRKTTQWYCNLAALPKAIKFLGESMCPGPQGGHDHSTSLVGKDENGKWRSAGSDEYTSNRAPSRHQSEEHHGIAVGPPCGAQLFVRWFWQAQRAFVTQRTAPVSVHRDTGATRAGMQSPAANYTNGT
jgi:hypothetical protein